MIKVKNTGKGSVSIKLDLELAISLATILGKTSLYDRERHIPTPQAEELGKLYQILHDHVTLTQICLR